MPPSSRTDVWDDAIRRYDRNVYLSVLALGLPPERARDIAQAAWTRLIEQDASGALPTLELPGLAIRQARFLGLNELQRTRTEQRVLATALDQPAPVDGEHQLHSRAQIRQALDALASCSPTARRVFALIYATPGGSPAKAAEQLGLSIQRVRQIVCETRARMRRALEEEIP